MMRVDIQQTLKWFSQKTTVQNRNEPLFTYLNAQLSILNPKLEREMFRTFLKEILVMLVTEIHKQLDFLAQPNLLNNVFQTQFTSQVMASHLCTLTEEICEWIHADGDGLTNNIIDKTVRVLRVRLEFWSSAPTRMVIQTYNNVDDTFDVSKEDLWNVLQARKNEDQEARDFLNSVGGTGAVEFVSTMFGMKDENKELVANDDELPKPPVDFVSSFFGGKKVEQEPKEGEGETFFSAIYDWFQS